MAARVVAVARAAVRARARTAVGTARALTAAATPSTRAPGNAAPAGPASVAGAPAGPASVSDAPTGPASVGSAAIGPPLTSLEDEARAEFEQAKALRTSGGSSAKVRTPLRRSFRAALIQALTRSRHRRHPMRVSDRSRGCWRRRPTLATPTPCTSWGCCTPRKPCRIRCKHGLCCVCVPLTLRPPLNGSIRRLCVRAGPSRCCSQRPRWAMPRPSTASRCTTAM